MEGKQPSKKAKKPNILFRLLALLVTAALVLAPWLWSCTGTASTWTR